MTAVLTDAARAALWGAHNAHTGQSERARIIGEYAAGRGGTPALAAGASEEMKDLARIARLGMCRVAVSTFKRGLSVVGFRSPDSADDALVWQWWQEQRLDARQALVHRPALTYGEGFVSVLPHAPLDIRARAQTWAPHNVVAEYADSVSLFPERATLWARGEDGWKVLIVDALTVTPATVPYKAHDSEGQTRSLRDSDLIANGEPTLHGATYQGRPVCPVVRFVDDGTDDDGNPVKGRGVVEPLIDLNRAINQVNLDRLVVARFGAYAQKIIISEQLPPREALVRMSAASVAGIKDHPDNVGVKTWPGSPLAPYNELIRELREQFALEAAIPLWATGSISNVSTDTAAMIEAAHQRELALKRESFGESWEMVLRLAAAMRGEEPPDEGAEVLWRDTEARTFSGVVDGIVKLDSTGVPVAELLDLIPGMTQQRIRAIREAMDVAAADRLLEQLGDDVEALPPSPIPGVNAADYDPSSYDPAG